MTPKPYNIPDQLKGDTFKGLLFTLKDNLGAAIDLTGATVKIDFRRGSKTGQLQKQLTIGNGVTMATPSLGKIQLDPFIVDFPPTTYYYDVQLTFSPTEVHTYIEGTMAVKQDVTQ